MNKNYTTYFLHSLKWVLAIFFLIGCSQKEMQELPSELPDIMPKDYILICYPDGKYGWIDNNNNYRSVFTYKSDIKAIKAAKRFFEPSEYIFPAYKYTTWEICEKDS